MFYGAKTVEISFSFFIIFFLTDREPKITVTSTKLSFSVSDNRCSPLVNVGVDVHSARNPHSSSFCHAILRDKTSASWSKMAAGDQSSDPHSGSREEEAGKNKRAVLPI